MATNEQRQQRRRVVREKPAGITQQGPDERAKRLTAELPMTRGDAVAVISLHSGVTTRRRPRANSGAFVAVVRETVGACGRGAVTSMSERQEELLEEILAWTRFSNRSDFIKALKDILADPKHLLAFELTDGSRTQTEVACLSQGFRRFGPSGAGSVFSWSVRGERCISRVRVTWESSRGPVDRVHRKRMKSNRDEENQGIPRRPP